MTMSECYTSEIVNCMNDGERKRVEPTTKVAFWEEVSGEWATYDVPTEILGGHRHLEQVAEATYQWLIVNIWKDPATCDDKFNVEQTLSFAKVDLVCGWWSDRPMQGVFLFPDEDDEDVVRVATALGNGKTAPANW